MAKKSKKIRSAGKYGPRYGRKIRKLAADIEDKMRVRYKCSHCGHYAVKRVGTAIWKCSKCGYTFSGGAYVPKTPVYLSLENKSK
ncbi:MAG: 50S ribosomal protein L37ae [Candidatus Methanoliparum thermophilum]|uniref:Large ribosomal subunit protein eL43 n=1 Tax=Methanoliparum thermophilum TaxID=2491083 RepID=A0A520KQF5_METT2|nr:50S ribosomal protein L37ae [Candidatus Methanoliparum sp. LAM-1]RZN63800.1 MAG: 50S ribosomal protein L37ae [Candidatus Methanoliparum thermophilum]BDC36479.1 50S ribosomal protein L37ae [Candidatus Methanoliparum sp. LAM-1]